MPATLATDSDHLDCSTPLIFASFTRCMELILFLDYGERPPASVMLHIIVKITIFWELTALPRLRVALIASVAFFKVQEELSMQQVPLDHRRPCQASIAIVVL